MLFEDVVTVQIKLDNVKDLSNKLPVYTEFNTRLYNKLNRMLQSVISQNDTFVASLIYHLLYAVDITTHEHS